MMTFQITDIDFDIDCSYEEMTIEDRQELYDEVVGAIGKHVMKKISLMRSLLLLDGVLILLTIVTFSHDWSILLT